MRYERNTLHFSSRKCVMSASMSLKREERGGLCGRVLLMKTTKVSDLMREEYHGRGVVRLHHDTNVADALHTLSSEHILSAPVVIASDPLDTHVPDDFFDDGANRELVETLIGFFDVHDAVRAFVQAIPSEIDETNNRSFLYWMTQISAVEEEIAARKLITVLGYDAELMYTPNARATSVYDLIVNGFRVSSSSLRHRVALFDAHGALNRIISQTDVFHWLAQHDRNLPQTLESYTWRQLGFGSAERVDRFVSVPVTRLTIEVFRLMHEKQVSGAAVLDKLGRIITDLTYGDLRMLTHEHWSALALPVAEFVACCHGASFRGYSAGALSGGESAGESAFFEKTRAFRSYLEEKRRNPRIDAIAGGSRSETKPDVTVLDLDSKFDFEAFRDENKRRVYLDCSPTTPSTTEKKYDVVTLTDCLNVAAFGPC